MAIRNNSKTLPLRRFSDTNNHSLIKLMSSMAVGQLTDDLPEEIQCMIKDTLRTQDFLQAVRSYNTSNDFRDDLKDGLERGFVKFEYIFQTLPLEEYLKVNEQYWEEMERDHDEQMSARWAEEYAEMHYEENRRRNEVEHRTHDWKQEYDALLQATSKDEVPDEFLKYLKNSSQILQFYIERGIDQ